MMAAPCRIKPIKRLLTPVPPSFGCCLIFIKLTQSVNSRKILCEKHPFISKKLQFRLGALILLTAPCIMIMMSKSKANIVYIRSPVLLTNGRLKLILSRSSFFDSLVCIQSRNPSLINQKQTIISYNIFMWLAYEQWLKWSCEAGVGAHLTKPGWGKPHTHSTPN